MRSNFLFLFLALPKFFPCFFIKETTHFYLFIRRNFGVSPANFRILRKQFLLPTFQFCWKHSLCPRHRSADSQRHFTQIHVDLRFAHAIAQALQNSSMSNCCKAHGDRAGDLQFSCQPFGNGFICHGFRMRIWAGCQNPANKHWEALMLSAIQFDATAPIWGLLDLNGQMLIGLAPCCIYPPPRKLSFPGNCPLIPQTRLHGERESVG